MAISHKDHDHPNTPAARAACRKAIERGDGPKGGVKLNADLANPVRKLAESAGIVKPATVWAGVKPKGRGATKVKASSKNLKRPGTQLRTIGDLPDVPRMLAYGCRLAWANDWEVRVGDSFNDNEARIVIDGTHAEIALVWKPSVPDGVWGVFVRNRKSSVTNRIGDVQTAFALAADESVWDATGNLVA